jgi:hypothetical protein
MMKGRCQPINEYTNDYVTSLPMHFVRLTWQSRGYVLTGCLIIATALAVGSCGRDSSSDEATKHQQEVKQQEQIRDAVAKAVEQERSRAAQDLAEREAEKARSVRDNDPVKTFKMIASKVHYYIQFGGPTPHMWHLFLSRKEAARMDAGAGKPGEYVSPTRLIVDNEYRVDVRKSDSLVSPFMGVLVVTGEISRENTPGVWGRSNRHRLVLNFALQSGKWVYTGGTQQREDSRPDELDFDWSESMGPFIAACIEAAMEDVKNSEQVGNLAN